MKIKNRHRLKSKDIKNVFSELKNTFLSISIDEKSSLEIGEFEGIKFVFVDGNPCFMYYEDKLVFTLIGIEKYKPKENFVVVDMGAVKFVTNGADVMAPGIIDADSSISKGDQVWINDEKNHKALAIGFTLMSGEEMVIQKSGKAVKLIHFVGDDIWNFVAKSL